MKARILALLLALVMVASLFAACSAGKTGTPDASTGTSQTPDDSKTTEDTKPAKTEKTKIVYWHSYTDQHEEKFLELAAAFNASQDEYELVAEQQPYSEIDSKTMLAVRNGTGPALVQIVDGVGRIHVHKVRASAVADGLQIGRASCRERVYLCV